MGTIEEERVIMRKAQKILNHKLRYKLPMWREEGTRKLWIKNLNSIINWNWSFYQSAISKRDKYLCQNCDVDSIEHNTGLETHHIIPRMSGGSDHPHNLKSLCPKCHRKETNILLKNKSAFHSKQRRLNA